MDCELNVHVEDKRFDGGPTIIADLNIRLRSGELVSLIAPSAGGKTTLLRLLAGHDTDFRGSVSLAGEPVTSPRRSVQLADQRKSLIPWKTLTQNLLFAAETETRETRRLATDMLMRVGLAGREHAWPKELSGGERARAVVARTLMAPPRALLLDEPFASLDVDSRAAVHELLTSSQAKLGFTILMASHRFTDSVALSDRIILLTTRPMTVQKEIEVPLARPRSLHDPQVAALAAKVRAAVQ